MGMGWLGNRGPVTKIDPILFKDRTHQHASTCTHTSTRSNIQGRKKRKKIGVCGLVNTISDLKRASLYNIRIYLNNCHKLSQNKKNNKILFPFLIRI